jgi:hypothetical protein
MVRSSRLALGPGLLLWVVLGLGCIEPLNTTPRGLDGPRADVSEAVPGQVVHLEAVVVDAEGDPLTFRWTQLPESPAGAFSDTAIASPTWTAPPVAETTNFILTMKVSDDHQNAIVGTVSVRVIRQ